jgi:hypothetical protein
MFDDKEKDKFRAQKIVIRPPLSMRAGSMLLIFGAIAISLWCLFIFVSDIINGPMRLDFCMLYWIGMMIAIYMLSGDVYHTAFVNHLVVSQKGIEFHLNGYKGVVLWENMSHFEYREIKHMDRWGIRFYGSIPLKNGVGSSPLGGGPIWWNIFLPIDYFLPVRKKNTDKRRVDLYHFQKTKLGSAIHYYAPHLFEYDAEKEKRG